MGQARGCMLSQDGLLTLDRKCTRSHGISGYLTHLLTTQYRRIEKDNMSTKRTWDETMSPQWKYLHQKESARKRGGRKTAARLQREEQEKEENEREPEKKERWKSIDKILKEKL